VGIAGTDHLVLEARFNYRGTSERGTSERGTSERGTSESYTGDTGIQRYRDTTIHMDITIRNSYNILT
jgi:hypothetical protein